MTDQQQEFYKMLRVPTLSLEEKMDKLYDLPDEDLTVLLKQFEADDDHEICCAIRTVFDEKRSDPDCYEFLGLV